MPLRSWISSNTNSLALYLSSMLVLYCYPVRSELSLYLNLILMYDQQMVSIDQSFFHSWWVFFSQVFTTFFPFSSLFAPVHYYSRIDQEKNSTKSFRPRCCTGFNFLLNGRESSLWLFGMTTRRYMWGRAQMTARRGKPTEQKEMWTKKLGLEGNGMEGQAKVAISQLLWPVFGQEGLFPTIPYQRQAVSKQACFGKVLSSKQKLLRMIFFTNSKMIPSQW